MKILMLADTEEKALWDNWSADTKAALSDVGLILSAGDLQPAYLEFLVTMLNVPLVYVRGNHDGRYDHEPPEGCIDADGTVSEIVCGDGEERRTIRIMGLGGSMRYKDDAPDMYTEKEMEKHIASAEKKLRRQSLKSRLAGSARPGGRSFDILLTHAPCRGYGDLDDLPHTGFECFNALLDRYRPLLQCYGHVHREYGGGYGADENSGFHRIMEHPSGTILINASGHYIYEI